MGLQMMKLSAACVAVAAWAVSAGAQTIQQTKMEWEDKFRQLGAVELPTPNVYRTASGAPGPQYWQQRADYKIDVRLDEDAKRIFGELELTYTNNSPDPLSYIWIQLDQNRFANNSIARNSATVGSLASRRANRADADSISYGQLEAMQVYEDIEYGFEISSVAGADGSSLSYTIVDTMMRVDLQQPLLSGEQTRIDIDWEHNIIEEAVIGGRGGYERFVDPDTGAETFQYFLAQWYPRATAYTDYGGWLNKSFLGSGEFTLEFGDYEVSITVPDDHIVAATGELQNPAEALSARQRMRLEDARESDRPIFIVTPDEARDNEAEKSTVMRRWDFSAENVRDFAWASSRKYIWDAMVHRQEGGEYDEVLAMSYYPREGEPLWSRYSTHAVAHTMEVYSQFAFPYPYPVAISVNTWARGGMEYPMITFNGYRPTPYQDDPDNPNDDGVTATYSKATKYSLIRVIIHEIGHIYFPMVVNSDERQWTWMDEGINTFLDQVASARWDDDYDMRAGADAIKAYMLSNNQMPIMTQSDSIVQFGPNAYTKPATALMVLRETVMGRDVFDFAFREYATRWRFKRPTPADFFRTMEDASGVDLDWFWRGWFYSTDHVDMAITDVRAYQLSTQDPDVEFPLERANAEARPSLQALFQQRNDASDNPIEAQTYIERNAGLEDFYNDNDDFTITNADRNAYQSFRSNLTPTQQRTLDRALEADHYYYFVDFDNVGGLVMPLPVQLNYADGDSELQMLSAEIWRRDSKRVTRLFVTDQPVAQFVLDPLDQIVDVDHANNALPREIAPSRLEVYRSDFAQRDQMRDALVRLRPAQ